MMHTSGLQIRKTDSAGDRVRHYILTAVGPLLVVGFCALKSPETLVQGRFWAEDAFFYEHALSYSSFVDKISYVYNGHIELIAILSHALASYLHPKMAPLLTGTIDLIEECVLAAMIVACRRDLRIGYVSALAICCLLVVSPVATEHYLNVLNSQWLSSAILFVMILMAKGRLEGHSIPIVVAALLMGMSSIGACSLLPLAVLSAYIRRSRPHVVLAAAVLFCCVVQGITILMHGSGARFQQTSPFFYLVAPFVQIVVKHLLGFNLEDRVIEIYRNGPMARGIVTPMLVPPVILIVCMVVKIARRPFSGSSFLLISFLYVTLFNEIFALGDRNGLVGSWGMRYFFLPGLIVALLLARSKSSSEGRGPTLGNVVLLTALLVSVLDFYRDGYNDGIVTSEFSWRKQVENCRVKSGSCRIRISPAGFFVNIPTGHSL